MNHEENKPEMQPWIEPELEARVIAWVGGEASAFEIAELERVVGEKPELGIFKRRLEAVQGLVQTAVRPDVQPLRLSPERRAKLLSVIGTTKQPPGSGGPGGSGSDRATTGSTPLVFPVRKRRAVWQRMLTIAAGLMIGLSIPAAFRLAEFKNRAPMELFEREAHVAQERVDSAARQNAIASDSKRAAERKAKAGYVAVELPSAPDDSSVESDAPALSVAAPPPVQAAASLRTGDGRGPNSILFGAGTPTGIKHPDSLSVGGMAEGTVAMDKFEIKADSSRSYGAAGSQLAGTRVQLPALDMPKVSLDQSVTFSDVAAASKPRSAVGAGQPMVNYYSAPGVQAKKLTKTATQSWGAGAKQQDRRQIAAPDASGQIGSAKVNEELLVLSPFSVSTEKEAAYRSRNRSAVRGLASAAPASKPLRPAPSDTILGQGGSELRKEVAPVANGELLKDLAATNSQAPLEYSTSPQANAPQKLAKQPNDLRAESNTAAEPVSTFSLHVSDVSFRLAQSALAQGKLPPAESVRPEEFYNAVKYADPAPAFTDKVACRVEQAAHPFLQQRNLVRVAMKVASAGRGVTQPLRLTVLLDTSGSMEREDRSASVQRALGVLTSLLGPNDRISLIGFARQPRLLADQLSGERAQTLPQVVQNTPAEGGTNLEAALKLAGEVANRQKDTQAQNRVVLLTDGAANLGNAEPAALASQIENLRQQGIAFDACGVGLEGIDDDMLEALTRKGDGRYYVLNTPDAADTDFAQQLAGAFRPAAQNVKVQVRFNPARVGNYRLIGFEKHRLKEEDFRNDKVDAAELAADEAAVALYQIEAKPDGQGELGEVYVRFRDAATGNMVERSWTLPYEAQPASFDRASSNLQLAGLAALVAEKMRGGAEGEPIHLADLAPVANQLRGQFPSDARVQELVAMYNQLRALGTP